jgi:cardiolipin synthase (CMP-forming)
MPAQAGGRRAAQSGRVNPAQQGEGDDEGSGGPGRGSLENENRAERAGRVRRQGEDRILSVPNIVSAARLCLVPVFVWLLAEPHRRDWFAAAVLLGVLGFTDGLDGQLARRLGQVTKVGKVLDTVADRVLLATAVIGTLAAGAIPVGVAAAAIAREAVVAVAAVLLALAGARRVDVTFLGKAGTFGLMCAFPLFLAGSSPIGWHHVATVLGWVSAIPALVLAWASLVVYAPLAKAALAGRQDTRRGQEDEPAG